MWTIVRHDCNTGTLTDLSQYPVAELQNEVEQRIVEDEHLLILWRGAFPEKGEEYGALVTEILDRNRGRISRIFSVAMSPGIGDHIKDPYDCAGRCFCVYEYNAKYGKCTVFYTDAQGNTYEVPCLGGRCYR